MDVATPTADCLTLVYDFLMPVIIKGDSKSTLSHQEVNFKLSGFFCAEFYPCAYYLWYLELATLRMLYHRHLANLPKVQI